MRESESGVASRKLELMRRGWLPGLRFSLVAVTCRSDLSLVQRLGYHFHFHSLLLKLLIM